MKRFFNKLKSKYLSYKIKEAKNSNSVYRTDTNVSFIIQTFNAKARVNLIYERLVQYQNCEIIFIDDGSVDGTLNELAGLLKRKNDFILRSNDIYEVRTYSKAIRMSNSPIICLLQDDDLPPEANDWIPRALQLFERWDNLMILGGRDGINLMEPEKEEEGKNKFKFKNNIASFPGEFRYRLLSQPTAFDPKVDQKFMFCMACNRAPTFIRKAPFLTMGGIDQNFAPYQCDDVDYCIRAWKNGYKVGLYESNFNVGEYTGGMRKYQGKEKHDQIIKNWNRIYTQHRNFIKKGKVMNKIDRLNSELDANLFE